MSFGQAVFENLVEHLYEALMQEGESKSYRCELGNLGTTLLHNLAVCANAARLDEFLNLKQHGNTVDIVDRESGVTPLVTACKLGHLDCVKVLVKHGANVNHRCSGRNSEEMCYKDITPIYVAAEEGHLPIVEYLANHGADVNVQMSPLGFTPVHRAVLQKHHSVVSVLIKKYKAKVNIPCLETPGSYPLYNALTVEDLDILEAILHAEDVDPNAADPSEHVTALHIAAYKGDVDAVQMLVSLGADVNVQLKSGHSPLDLAIQQKNRHVVEFLKQARAQRKILDKSWHPFIFCVVNGLQSLKTAVNRGADVNALLTPKGGTALHFSVMKRKMDACKFLIRKGADLNRKDAFGRTPLFIAADYGYVQFIEFLLDKGADINAQSDVGFTPVHRAALKGHGAACKVLIDRGADLELKARELGPPLIGAVHQGNTSIVKLLLKAGANPNATNPLDSVDYVNVLQIAVQFAANKPEILKALIEAGAEVRRDILTHHGTLSYLHILPMVTDNVESLKIMIEAGAFIDATAICLSNDGGVSFCIHVNCAQGGDGCMPVRYSGTPLQSVKKEGRPALVRLLENTDSLFKAVRKNDLPNATKYHAQGGLINCCSIRYDTPLIYASWKGYDKMVKFLLAQGAKIDMPNVQNSSPLHYAAKYNQKQVAIELLKAGAPIDLIRCGKTPLQLAQEKSQNSDVAAILDFTRRYLVETRKNKLSHVLNWKSDPKIVKLVLEFDGKISEADLAALFEF